MIIILKYDMHEMMYAHWIKLKRLIRSYFIGIGKDIITSPKWLSKEGSTCKPMLATMTYGQFVYINFKLVCVFKKLWYQNLGHELGRLSITPKEVWDVLLNYHVDFNK